MDGDTVQVVINENGRGGRTEARVLKVAKHANETLIGTFEKNKNFRFRDPGQPADHHGYLYPQGRKWRGIRAQSCGKAGYLRGENKNRRGHVKGNSGSYQ